MFFLNSIRFFTDPSGETIEINFTAQQQTDFETELQPLAFLSYLYGSSKEAKINSKRYLWHMIKS